MSISVASNPTRRAVAVPPAPAALTTSEQRLPQLLDAVAAGGRCGSPEPGIPTEWHRMDGEPADEWYERVQELRAVCAACPVMQQCRESALRQGEGSKDEYADQVRGGLTGRELYDTRIAQADRLAAAAEEDARTAARAEEERLRVLAAALRRWALSQDQPHNQAKHNREIRSITAEMSAVRAARRVRSGWSSAA